MPAVLNADQTADLIRRGFTRRNFGRIASVITAGAALPFYNEPALAQLSRVRNIPEDAVKIDANENPLGPCPEAADAIHNVIKKGGP
jgi:histidinol-phosphate aminotransferase